MLDLDETVLDNSAYQVWNIKAGQSFSLKTWNEFCAAQISRARLARRLSWTRLILRSMRPQRLSSRLALHDEWSRAATVR